MAGPLRIMFCCFIITISMAGAGVVFTSNETGVQNTNTNIVSNYINTNQNHLMRYDTKYNNKVSLTADDEESDEWMSDTNVSTVTGSVLSYLPEDKSIEFIEDGEEESIQVTLAKTSSLLTTLLNNDVLDDFSVSLDLYENDNERNVAIVTGAEQISDQEIVFAHAFDLTGENIIINGICRWQNKESSHVQDATIIMHDLYLGDTNSTEDDYGATIYVTNTNFRADNIYSDTSRLIWNKGSIINVDGVIRNSNYLYLDCDDNVTVKNMKIINEANCYVVNKDTSRLNEALKDVDFINHQYLRLGWGLMVNSLENIDGGYFETYSQAEGLRNQKVLNIIFNHQLITTERQKEFVPLVMADAEAEQNTVQEKCTVLPIFSLDGNLKEFQVRDH